MKTNIEIKLGKRYKTRGGWSAFIYALKDGRPVGWCKDSFGKEEPGMGVWDKNTGKCIKRGTYTDDDITKPYDIILK